MEKTVNFEAKEKEVEEGKEKETKKEKNLRIRSNSWSKSSNMQSLKSLILKSGPMMQRLS